MWFIVTREIVVYFRKLSRNDDDFADRLNHRFTPFILVLFAGTLTVWKLADEPITCWVPAHFSGSHETYANNYCWVRSTYWLPFEDYIPKEHEHEKRHIVPYYQWMPMILLVQALLFYMPVMVWRTLNGRSGIDVNNIVEAGESFQDSQRADSRDKTLKYMTKQMDRYLCSQQQYRPGLSVNVKSFISRTLCIFCGRRQGNFLVATYIFSKLIFIANIFGQLFLLNIFLGMDYHNYGIDVVRGLINGEPWSPSPRFPRVTMCDFKVRRLGNVQRYTVQCVLNINLYNEMIYLFLWFWMLFVAAVTIFSLVTWCLRSAFRIDRYRYVKKHLMLMSKLQPGSDKAKLVRFVEDYLRQDGVLVLRLLGHNTNAITVTEFLCSLWDNYLDKKIK